MYAFLPEQKGGQPGIEPGTSTIFMFGINIQTSRDTTTPLSRFETIDAADCMNYNLQLTFEIWLMGPDSGL